MKRDKEGVVTWLEVSLTLTKLFRTQHFVLLIFLMSNINISAQIQTLEFPSIPRLEFDNILQGKLYIPEYPRTKGSQFLFPEWKSGSIQLYEQSYSDLRLWYDLYLDALIWWNTEIVGEGRIVINKDQLTHFNIENQKFINFSFSKYNKFDLKNGYYEVMVDDEVSLLCKRKVKLIPKATYNQFEREDTYYLIINQSVTEIENRKKFLKQFSKEDQEQIKKYLRENKIIFRSISDIERIRLVQFINRISAHS